MLRFLWGFPNVPGVPDRSCRRQLVRMCGLHQTYRRRTLEAADRAEPREAFAQIRLIPDGEEPILRKHVEQLVEAFRAFRLVAA